MAKILHILEFFVLLNVVFNFVESSINLALNKPTTQSSNYRQLQYLSENAVDGNTSPDFADGSCSCTAARLSSAWWQVDLGNVYEIKQIVLYNRNDHGYGNFKQRLNGYSIDIIKSLDPLISQLCYDDPINVLPATLTPKHNCSYQGRYVNLSVERRPGLYYPDYDDLGAFINMCEFEVYGCNVGYHGNNNCNIHCSAGCINSRCDPDDGTCSCKTGWKGSKCYERACPIGQYGQSCQSCSSGCLGEICDVTDGQCIDGCKSGSYGLQCDRPCPGNCDDRKCYQDTGYCQGCKYGSYGLRCDHPCPRNCNGGTCNKDTGYCNGCKYGSYGLQCDQPCPRNCNDGSCNKDTGYCNGCKPGLFGSQCDQLCPRNCANGTCNHDTGHCNGCVTGNYSADCNFKCPTGCKNGICHQNSGDCIESCDDFFTGMKCTVCQTGYYETTSCQPCLSGCLHNICSPKNGSCAGCKAGFHGEQCNLTCSVHCIREACNQGTSKCDLGCTNGFYGPDCHLKCSSGCKTDKCYQNSGGCIDGCINGFTNTQCRGVEELQASPSIAWPVVGAVFATLVFVAVVLVIIYIIRRLRTKHKSSDYEDVTPNGSGDTTTKQTYEDIKKPSIYTNDAFYEFMAGTAESQEQNDDIAQNDETP